MNISFYFDPSCPFCWITSRWLLRVAKDRSLDITWKPFSLAIKNDELVAKASESTHANVHRSAHRILRVIEAAAADGADRLALYTTFGKMMHVDGYDYDDTAISLGLTLNKLPATLVEAADDTKYDKALTASMQSALDIVGNDVGVPIIVFEPANGQPTGYFGPVLQSLPNQEDGLKLWDGLAAIATTKEFYELKRTRPQGNPDTGSTKPADNLEIC